MGRFKVSSSKVLLRDLAFDVTLDRAVASDGQRIEKHVLKHPGAVVILARDDGNQVLLTRQYRLPLQKEIWELPAGKLDGKEPRLKTAKRELAEETGYRARRWRKLLDFYPAPGFCDERMTAYEAGDLTAGEATPEPYERFDLDGLRGTKRWRWWRRERFETERRLRLCCMRTVSDKWDVGPEAGAARREARATMKCGDCFGGDRSGRAGF